MIGLYTLSNLNQPYAKIPITSGNVSAERNGYYQLTFTILNKYLKENQIIINQQTIFKVDGLFYACVNTGNNDFQKVEQTFVAELLQTQILMFTYIEKLKLEGTNVIEALSCIIGSTILEMGECDISETFDLEVSQTNGQAVLSQILELSKGEVYYEGLKIGIRRPDWQESDRRLVKGKDFTTLDERTDLSDVITRLHYRSTTGAITGVIDSPNLSRYGFVREGYQEFDSEDEEIVYSRAEAYLAMIDTPSCHISISIPKVRKLSLNLCETVRLHNTLLDEELTYKVISYNKSLTKEDDIYELGQRKKDFSDIEELIQDRTQEIVQEVVQNVIVEVIEQEVISAKTAHLLNAWVRDLNVEYLETNFEALDVRQSYPIGGIRNFIRIKEEQIEFVTQTLSEDEVENYKNKEGRQIYYTAIGDHIQAYRYFTVTSPNSIYQDLTEEQIDQFKVKVRKVISETVKASFAFGFIEETQFPIMQWGAGTDATGVSDKGKGFIYKALDGLVMKYITSNGSIHQIKLGENGIEGIENNGETIIQNINMGGLIEIPGQALTKASFNESGVTVEHGETTTTFNWTKDTEGRITSLYNSQTGLTVPVSWS